MVVRMFPIFLTTIFYWTIYSQVWPLCPSASFPLLPSPVSSAYSVSLAVVVPSAQYAHMIPRQRGARGVLVLGERADATPAETRGSVAQGLEGTLKRSAGQHAEHPAHPCPSERIWEAPSLCCGVQMGSVFVRQGPRSRLSNLHAGTDECVLCCADGELLRDAGRQHGPQHVWRPLRHPLGLPLPLQHHQHHRPHPRLRPGRRAPAAEVWHQNHPPAAHRWVPCTEGCS